MSPRERWALVEALYNAARERDDDARVALLDDACGGDIELRREVESLLAQPTSAGSFLDRPAFIVAAHTADERSASGLAGQRLGNYELLALLGAGGMGNVYRARDTRLGRDVALKILPRAFTHDAGRVARFRREAQVLASVNHPHICTIYDIGQTDAPHRQHFIVMEKLEGATLKHVLATRSLDEDVILSLAFQLADALDTAHAKHVIHRDIKPANIFVTDHGAKILDFGVAKLVQQATLQRPIAVAESSTRPRDEVITSTGALIGTAAYMSPEQARGRNLDTRSDLFSLGVVLYEMATRTRPFQGETTAAILDAILNRAPIAAVRLNPELSPELDGIITRLLEKDRDIRYLTAADVRADLERVQRHQLSSRATADVGRTPSTTTAAVTERDEILLADFTNTTGEPIFDGTLKQALAVKLEESPYLNIVSDDRIQQTLRLMARPSDERLTAVVSREICERQGIKAMVAGAIASLGSRYVVTLTAFNCQNGDSIARVQAEAASKERVLRALGAATARLRRALGESLASIRRFDMPLEDVTTPSLDALKVFSLARLLRMSGKEREAIPLLKHAIDLDPNFAQAHNNLAAVYDSLREPTLRDRYLTQAYERRSRVTERERLLITGFYQQAVTGDLLKFFETVTLLQQTYPRFAPAYNMLGVYYSRLGQFDRAADAFRETARLAPDTPFDLTNLAGSYIGLNRLDEAKAVLERAVALKSESAPIHRMLGTLAYLQHDDAARKAEQAWLTEHDPSGAFGLQAWTACLAGKLRDAREYVVRRADLDIRAGLVDSASLTWLGLAETEAACGVVEAARRGVTTALKLASSRDLARRAACILATSGFQEEAQSLLDRCVKEYPPTHTLAQALYIPAIRAAFDLTRGQAAAAIEALQTRRLTIPRQTASCI